MGESSQLELLPKNGLRMFDTVIPYNVTPCRIAVFQLPGE